MYFSHISIGGGIVGVETVISIFDNICSSLKKKNTQQNFKGKKFSFAIVDTKPENIPGGVAYGFQASQYGYFNNPLRLSPDHLKKWISLKDNKKKIVRYIKKYGGFTGKIWLKDNLHILNSSKKPKFMELYFPRVLANFWMEEKLLLLLKKMKKFSKEFSTLFKIKFIKGNVISIRKKTGKYAEVSFKDNKYEVLELEINKNHSKKINFKNIGNFKIGSIYSITQCVSLGLPPPKELATERSRDHANYIRDFYYSGATANLINKVISIKKKHGKKKIIIYFIGYKAGLLEPLSELKNIIQKYKISIEIICSSPDLLGIQKAQGSSNKKVYKLSILNINQLIRIKTAKKLFSSILAEFEIAKKKGYKKYDAWTQILNNEILNKCIKNFNYTEKNLYKNIIFHKIRAITRFTYPTTIEARDELISSGILKAKKETVKKVDTFKNKLFVSVNDFYKVQKKYFCDLVVNVSGPLSALKLKNEWPVIDSIKKNNGKIIEGDELTAGGFSVNDNFELINNKNIYLPGYLASGFNPARKTIIKAILENSHKTGQSIAKTLYNI